jgi:hypothetical protein
MARKRDQRSLRYYPAKKNIKMFKISKFIRKGLFSNCFITHLFFLK